MTRLQLQYLAFGPGAARLPTDASAEAFAAWTVGRQNVEQNLDGDAHETLD